MTEIFVFGSNIEGRHGKGAALAAVKQHGAIYGQGEGLQGRSYAIPTKGVTLRTLVRPVIARHVKKFLTFASERDDLDFMVTQIGCGLAGYQPVQIAPMFKQVPSNVYLPAAFLLVLHGKVIRSRLSFEE